MAYLMKKSRIIQIAKGLGFALIVLFTGCRSDQSYKYQVNGNIDYLNTPSLHALINPPGIILPLQNGEYEIPPFPLKGAVGKELDIRPPAQRLDY